MKPLSSWRRLARAPIAAWQQGRPAVRRLVVVVLLATAGLVAGQQGAEWWLVTRLAWQLQRADDVQAPYLVRELARCEHRAFHVLVDAASSPRAAVALSARREIDTRVDFWQREAYLHPATFNLATTATPLAEAFASKASTMGPSARRWARQTLEDLADLASAQPLDMRLDLLAACDRGLAELPREDKAAALADAGAARVGLMLSAPPEPIDPTARAVVVPTKRKLPEGLIEMPSVAELSATPLVHKAPAAPSAQQWPGPHATPPPLGEIPREEEPSAVNPLRTRPLGETTATVPERFPSILPEQVRPLPTGPADSGPDWFEILVRGNSAEQQLAADKLAEQGYGRVVRDDAMLLLSASTDDRKSLVDNVITSPRLEAPAWLALLLRDRAPEVRASAISAIATSNDEKLLSLALEIALNDPSPAVADQVPLLRARLR